MLRNLTLMATAILLLSLLPATSAQSDGKPTVMFLDEGMRSSYALRRAAALDVLQSYGFIQETERALLMEGQDYEGERLNIIFGSTGLSLGDAYLEIERALDLGVDVIVAQSTIPAQAAASVTLDIDDPPVVIFATISNVAAVGIAQTTCVKPDHITGMETIVPYEEVVSLLQIHDPEMTTIGMIYSSGDAEGVYGAERIVKIASGMGLAVESAAITAIADMRAATQSLVGKGVEAIILPYDPLTTGAMPIAAQVAVENGVPLFYSSPGIVYLGATIAGGSLLTYEEGAHSGLLLSAYLNGDIDIPTTGIYQASNMFVGLNLDLARQQGVAINDDLLERASIVIQDGQPILSGAAMDQLARLGQVVPLEERRESDMAILESIQCTPERIAEQRAELAAAGE